MQDFCISLGLSLESQKKLNNYIFNIQNKPNITDFFYHTTLFQGFTHSYELLHQFIFEFKEDLLGIYFNELMIWEKFIKKNEKVLVERFNNNLDVIILNYRNSSLLNCISKNLFNILTRENLLINLKDDKFQNILLNNSQIYKFNYIFEYYYKSKIGLNKPHTTLGYAVKDSLDKKIIQEINKKINDEINFAHDGIYLSKLNELCMTSNLGKIQILSF